MSSDSPASSDNDRGLAIGASVSLNGLANGKLARHVNGNNAGGNTSSFSQDDNDDGGEDVPLSKATRTKPEPASPQLRPRKRKKPIRDESSSSDDDDIPLASTSPVRSTAVRMDEASTVTTRPANGKGRGRKKSGNADARDEGNYEDGDTSTIAKKRKSGAKAKAAARHPQKKRLKGGPEDDDTPLMHPSSPAKAKRKAATDEDSAGEDAKSKNAQNKKSKVKAETDGDDAPNSKPKRKSKAKTEEVNGSPAKKGRAKKEDDEEEEVFRWWEQDMEGDGSVKWQTLEHNGVIFPLPYEPLPSHVKMKYNGKPVDLPPAAEEVAGFYAAMVETDHAQDQTFNKNFFEDWKAVLKKHPPRDGTRITSFNLCDFRPLFEYFEEEKAKKKSMTTAEKKEIKKAKDEAEAKYTTCLLDGRKEKVGNFRVEPPGLFRGRGDHPKKGALKARIRPEDITINIGEGVPIPVPNMPGNWKRVIHDQTVTWLANWTENINGNHKYVFLAAGSSLKGQSDMVKFEKARELKNHVDAIRREYTADLKNKVMADRQRATAMYFIDRLALRAGNEKGEDEADTVGCCSLRCEHVTLEAPNFIIFDFLGKDSIRYYNRVAVEAQVFKNIRIFKENKTESDHLFDRVNTSLLNKHLTSKMKGLTAKVFRTYNASITFQQQLDENSPVDATVQEKLNAYNLANRMVAILCNHQRSVPKTHDQSMEKMRNRLRALKYERMKLRHALFGIDSKYKNNRKYAGEESDIDDEWIEGHEEQLKAKDIEKAEKKYAKDNEKLVEDGKEPRDESVLKEKIDAIEEEYKKLEEERGTGKATLRRERLPERLEEQIVKLDEKIKTFKLQMQDRDAGKEVALGTSKINYLDPRITQAWCKTHDVPIEKIFSKTLLVKFPWAMEVDGDWKF